MFKYIKMVVRKELKAVFSDKRLVFTIFILPFVSIAIMYAVIGFMVYNDLQDKKAQEFNIGLINAESDFLDFSRTSKNLNFRKINAGDDYKSLIKSGKLDYVLEFSDNYQNKLDNYQTTTAPTIKGYYYDKNNYANEIEKRISDMMDAYSTRILTQRFPTESSYNPFQFSSEKLTFEDAKSGKNELLASPIPLLITTFMFAGAMSIGMDSFAGEKERGTMATLLMTTSPRQAIFIGKMGSLAIVAILSTLSSLLSMLVIFVVASKIMATMGETISLSYKMTALDAGLLLLCFVGIIAVFSAMIAIVSLFAKNIKEANSYISPLYMVVVIMGYATMFGNATPSPLQKYLPILSNITNVRLIFLGQSDAMLTLYAFTTSLALSIVLTIIASKMLNSEKYIF